MAHSRETEHYQLPLYDGTDIINPLTDFNNANEQIDEALYNANERSVEAKEAAEAATQSIGQYDDRIAAAETTANNAVEKAEKTQLMMAEEFNPLKDGGYQIGDIVVNDNKLWEFINPHSGAWDSADVKSVVIGDALQDTITDAKEEIAEEVAEALVVIGEQTEKVTKTQAMIAPAFDANKAGGYPAKSVVTFADKLYMFNTNHIGAWTGSDVTQITVADELGKGEVSVSRKAIFIGDSWQNGYMGQGVTPHSYTSIIASAGIFDEIYKTTAENAPGFVRGTNFLQQFMQVSSGVEGITDVIIEGGVNDLADNVTVDQMVSAAEALFAAIKAKYPKAKIYYFPNALISSNYVLGNFNMVYPITYLVAKFNSEGVIADYRPILSVYYDKDFWYSDNVHLNVLGYDTYGANILSVLVGGECHAYPLTKTTDNGAVSKTVNFTYTGNNGTYIATCDKSGNVRLDIKLTNTGAANMFQIPDDDSIMFPRNSMIDNDVVRGSRVAYGNDPSTPMSTHFADCVMIRASNHYFFGTSIANAEYITHHLEFNIFDPFNKTNYYCTSILNH